MRAIRPDRHLTEARFPKWTARIVDRRLRDASHTRNGQAEPRPNRPSPLVKSPCSGRCGTEFARSISTSQRWLVVCDLRPEGNTLREAAQKRG